MTAAGGRRLVLASGSPRRRELLERLGVVCEVVPAGVDETVNAAEAPDASAEAPPIEEPSTASPADQPADAAEEVAGKPPERLLRRDAAVEHEDHPLAHGGDIGVASYGLSYFGRSTLQHEKK